MRVAVVSNWDERCGNGEYARNLVTQLEKRFEVTTLVSCPPDKFDAVVINYHPPCVHFSMDDLRRMKENGTKVILLLQESTPSVRIDSESTYCKVDAVVAHEPMDITGAPVNFRTILHGLPVVNGLGEGYVDGVGTAGFAFPAKRMDITVKAANHLQTKAVVIAPKHHWRDPEDLYSEWSRICYRIELTAHWLPQEEVVRRLAKCAMVVYFAEEGDAPGQSGSALIMAAAERPMIIKRCRKTKMMQQYDDELYFVETEQEVYRAASEIWEKLKAGEPVKRPKRLIEDMSWNTTGRQFCDLVEELCGSRNNS